MNRAGVIVVTTSQNHYIIWILLEQHNILTIGARLLATLVVDNSDSSIRFLLHQCYHAIAL